MGPMPAPAPPLVFVTGFGSFEEVEDNPSAAVARRLSAAPPAGIEVRSTVLPVSFARAPGVIDEALAELAPRVPDLLLGLGVDKRGTGYRLELRARGRLEGAERQDVDGGVASGATLDLGPDLRTELDLAGLANVLEAEALRLSEDAGGYVCERICHHLLARGRQLERPALFVHVPPSACKSVAEQTHFVTAVIAQVFAAWPG